MSRSLSFNEYPVTYTLLFAFTSGELLELELELELDIYLKNIQYNFNELRFICRLPSDFLGNQAKSLDAYKNCK
jgi:hypothetical protein